MYNNYLSSWQSYLQNREISLLLLYANEKYVEEIYQNLDSPEQCENSKQKSKSKSSESKSKSKSISILSDEKPISCDICIDSSRSNFHLVDILSSQSQNFSTSNDKQLIVDLQSSDQQSNTDPNQFSEQRQLLIMPDENLINQVLDQDQEFDESACEQEQNELNQKQIINQQQYNNKRQFRKRKLERQPDIIQQSEISDSPVSGLELNGLRKKKNKKIDKLKLFSIKIK